MTLPEVFLRLSWAEGSASCGEHWPKDPSWPKDPLPWPLLDVIYPSWLVAGLSEVWNSFWGSGSILFNPVLIPGTRTGQQLGGGGYL